MNVARLALAAVAATIADMAFGFVVYGTALAGQFAQHQNVYRPGADTSYMPFLMAGVFVAPASRSVEYDTVSGKYCEYLENEILPLVEQNAKIKLTKDPEGRGTIGQSSGGAAAFTMAWFHPELYHRVLTYSGTYVSQQSPKNPETPHGAWEYHEHLVPAAEPKPIRV